MILGSVEDLKMFFHLINHEIQVVKYVNYTFRLFLGSLLKNIIVWIFFLMGMPSRIGLLTIR
jgi:hypothetical protein